MSGEIVAANDALASLLGYSDGEPLVGQSVAKHHPAPELALELLRERLLDGGIDGLDIDALDRHRRPIAVRISARLDSMQGSRVIVFSAENVTAESRSAVSSRAHKMQALELFAAGIAHDYNNLLTAIVAESSSLVAELSPTDPHAESARIISASAERAAAITRKLAVLSRGEPTRSEIVDLSQEVTSFEAHLRTCVREDVSIALRLAPGTGAARMDRDHVRRVMENLVINAGEAMPAGGRVVIETSTVMAPEDTDGLAFDPWVPPGEYVSLSVGDTGEGMSPETRARIFDPFFTTKVRGEGAGLGLSVVYGLVLRASGHIAVISAPGWGTVVRVLYPRCMASAAVPAPSPPRPVRPTSAPRARRLQGGAGKRVLVVDDEHAVLTVMTKILRRAGYATIEARDAFEAQDRMRQLGNQLDLVLTDLVMPRRTGIDLVRWMRERFIELPVLLVSGYADDPTVRAWVEADPQILLRKPFTPAELCARVEERIGLAVR
jgi:two-component system cell cycle sensor histidine kinase/response regulator CckA